MAGQKSPLTNPWLLAITPSMLCVTPVLAPFISTTHRFFYHLDGSAPKLIVALLLNLLVPWLFFVAVLAFADRFRPFRILFWSVFVLLLPWLLLHDYAVLMVWNLTPTLNKAALYGGLGALVLEAILWQPIVSRHFSQALRGVQGLTALISLGWLVTIGQLIYYTVATLHLNTPRPFHAASLPAPNALDGRALHGRPRIIWIIFDELGYDETYGRRFPGLQLPAFDQLGAQSAVFTEAVAPGDFTEQVIPAVILGDPAAKNVKFNIGGQLFYREQRTDRWQAFDPYNTVFQDALQQGYTTAVDGWHNPYCRILAPVLDSCFWSSRVDSTTPDFDAAASFGANLLGPARRIVRGLIRSRGQFTRQGDEEYLGRHLEDVRALLAGADRLIANPAADFLLLHIPVPHPAGIYDRRRGVMDNHGHYSYVDNLALADRILAHLHGELAARGEWDPSAVIVMGDHGWRTKLLWEGQRSWTAEDQLASHGGEFDPRPGYIVKLPNEHTGVEVANSFPTLRTRALLDRLMSGEVRTVPELQAWVAQPPAASPGL